MDGFTNTGDRIWARDLAPNFLSDGEVYNVDAVNNAVDNLVVTSVGERVLNFIGTPLKNMVFLSNKSAMISEMTQSIIETLTMYAWHIDPSTIDVEVKHVEKAVYLKVKYQTRTYEYGEIFTKHEVGL